MPFVGVPTFLRAPQMTPGATPDGLRAAILGIPFDEGQPYMSASRLGPRALREQSLRFVASAPGIYDPEDRRTRMSEEMSQGLIGDFGDVDVLPTNIEGSFTNITTAVRHLLDEGGAVPIILGGDHSVTYPVVRAYDRPLHVIHYDAHLDYAAFVHGVQFSNSNPFRHIRKLNHVSSLTQLGIRSLRNTAEMHDDSERDGNRVVTMNQYQKLGATGTVDHLPPGADVYVSVDVDVLDISLVPGCISAEPNGMSYQELMSSLIHIARKFNVVGFDLVEISPPLDVRTQITSYLGAHVVVEFLSHLLDDR